MVLRTLAVGLAERAVGVSARRSLALVEAGGVEPPSEESYGQETTCLAQFASSFRRRPSGTGKNEPPASLLPREGLSLRIPRRLIPSHPAKRRLTSLMRA